jgi:ABC-type amino acid transport substrate-binding protein
MTGDRLLSRAGAVLAALTVFGLLLFSSAAPALAACSRPINLIYSSKQVAAVYLAQPARGLPSLADAIAQKSGCVLQPASYPPARAWDALAANQVDALIGGTYVAERAAQASFVPLLKTRWLLLTNADAHDIPSRLEDFAADRHLLIGKIRGTPYPPDVEVVLARLLQQHQIDESVDTEMALNKLIAHRDSALIMTAGGYLTRSAQIRKQKLQRIVQPQFAPALAGMYLNKTSLSEADRNALLAAANAVLADDLPLKLLSAYMEEDDNTLVLPVTP